jgi:hypothetical protein
LPDPVGAEISTCSPVAIAGHACACASVGAANACSNHARVRGAKESSGEEGDEERAIGSVEPSVGVAKSLPS